MRDDPRDRDRRPTDAALAATTCLPPAVRQSAERNAALAARARTGDEEARNALVESVARLAYLVASRVGRLPGADLENAAGDATLRMLNAADRFDPDRGTLVTFAYRTMWGGASDSLKRDGKLRRPAIRAVEQAHLGAIAADGTDATAADLDADRARVREALAAIPAREARILRLRFGIGVGPNPEPRPTATLEAVGREVGLTKERVRQLEARALRRMARVLGAGEARP